MINETTTIAVMPLAEELALKGITVQPKPTTPLYDLVRLCHPTVVASNITSLTQANAGVISSNDYGQLLSKLTNSENALYAHNQAIDELVNVLSPSVTAHVGFAKNIVVPVIADMIKAVEDQMRLREEPNAESLFTISVLTTPSFIEDSVFINELKRYEGKAIIQPKAPMDHALKDEAAILELMLTGDKAIDKQIVEWVSQVKQYYTSMNIDIFSTVWCSFFGLKIEPSLFITTQAILLMNDLEKSIYASFIYLIARKLALAVDSSNQSAQLASAYMDSAVWWRDFAGTVLLNSQKVLSNYKTAERFVVEVNKAKKRCIVYGDVYNPWLQNGGNVELLLGSIISNEPAYMAEQFTRNKQKYEKEWNTYKLFYNANISNQAVEGFKDVLRYCFNNGMQNLHADELSYMQNMHTARDCINDYLEEELALLTLTDVTNIALTVERIVTKSRFYYTDSYVILEQMRLHPDIEPRESALLATICYVVRYLVDQVHLTTKL